MCWFITLILPIDHVENVRDHINHLQANDADKSGRLMLLPVSDKDVAHLVPPGFKQCWLVNGNSDHACSCGMYWDPRVVGDQPSWRDRLLEGLRRKGKRKKWSQAKIERALAQAAEAHPPPEDFHGLWAKGRQLVADIVATSGQAGIFVRWLTGRPEEDRIPHIRVHRASVSRLLVDENLLLPGELLWIGPR